MIFFQVRHVVILEVICHGMKDSPQCLFVLYAAALHLSRADKLVITLVILGVVTVVCRLGVHVRHDCSDRMDDYFPPMALASPAFTTPTSGVLRQPEPSTWHLQPLIPGPRHTVCDPGVEPDTPIDDETNFGPGQPAIEGWSQLKQEKPDPQRPSRPRCRPRPRLGGQEEEGGETLHRHRWTTL